jgi:hypothetical protein
MYRVSLGVCMSSILAVQILTQKMIILSLD